jgi:putative ABC transport system ATP-binding protein
VNGGVPITLAGVGKRFATPAGPVDAVTDVDLHVAAGTGLAITGPSGCGKSTLLSLIGALERPSHGRIDVAGHTVSAMGEPQRATVRRELIGFVFQSDNLQPFLTAVENISLQLALAGVVDADDRAVELLDTLGLRAKADRYPDELSGGERQRIAVARAIVHRPHLMLADEPTGALDVAHSQAVIDLLRHAQAEAGATLIVITHDGRVADRFDRRIALLDGRVVHDSGAARTPMTDPAGA